MYTQYIYVPTIDHKSYREHTDCHYLNGVLLDFPLQKLTTLILIKGRLTAGFRRLHHPYMESTDCQILIKGRLTAGFRRLHHPYIESLLTVRY